MEAAGYECFNPPHERRPGIYISSTECMTPRYDPKALYSAGGCEPVHCMEGPWATDGA